MIHKLAQYRIREGEEAAVLVAFAEFVAAVRSHEPATRYEAFRLGEGPDFLHVMTFPDAAAEQRHRHAPYTERFVAALYPRCTTPPASTALISVDG